MLEHGYFVLEHELDRVRSQQFHARARTRSPNLFRIYMQRFPGIFCYILGVTVTDLVSLNESNIELERHGKHTDTFSLSSFIKIITDSSILNELNQDKFSKIMFMLNLPALLRNREH